MAGDTTEKARTRVLVVKMSSLGDVTHALPIVHLLKTGLDADVDWVVQPEYADLVSCCEDVGSVLRFPRRGLAAGAGAFLRALRRERYDYVIDLQGLLKSALVSVSARGGRRIGPSFHREGAALFYHDVAGARDKDRHAIDEMRDVLRFLELPDEPIEFRVRFPEYVLAGERRRIVFVAQSRWPTKNWPLEHFIETGRRLHEQAGAFIHVVGGAGDRDACEVLTAGMPGFSESHAGRTTLVELGGLLQAADLVISPDTGPMHLAVAAGTPVLALFGPTDPKRTGPYGDRHRVLTAPRTPCWPCRDKSCPACIAAMRDMAPDQVIAAALEMLNAQP